MIKAKVIDIDGLTLIYERTNVNKMFCLLPYFRTGALTETDANCGITHFLEHMFKKRTKDMNPDQIAEKLRVYMPRYNAWTGFEYMGIDCYTSLRYKEEAIKILASLVQDTVFDDEDVVKESKVIEQEIGKYEIQNGFIASTNLVNTIYKYPPIKNAILGTKEKVLSYKAKDIKARHDELVTKQNMILSFSGDMSEKQVVELVKKYFNRVPSHPKKQIKNPILKINGTEDIVVCFKEQDNSITVKLAFACNFDYKDEKQRTMASFLSTFLNNRGYPMFEQMRNKKSLVYGYGANINGFESAEYYNFNFQTSKQNIKECITTYASVIDDLYNNGLQKTFFEDIKQSYIVDYDARIEKPMGRASSNASKYLNNLEFFDLDKHLKVAQSITLEEFNAFVKKLFKNNFVCASLVGNCSKDDIQTLEELREMFYKN